MYKTSSLKLEKRKGKYYIKVEKTNQNERFINSFLFTTKELMEKMNINMSEANTYEIELLITKSIPLNDYLKKGINYEYLERLYINLNEQINFLKKNNIGVVKISHKDIFVWESLDDILFVFLNNDNITEIDYGNKITITKPFKTDDYTSPELKAVKKIPFTILDKSSLWSLGKVMMYCLKKYKDTKNINKNSGENILNKILNTRLYWAIQRNLESNAENRFSILI